MGKRQAEKVVQAIQQGASVLHPVTPQRDWKAVIGESFRNLGQLLEYCQIDVAQLQPDASPSFPLRVTRYYASLIEKGNARDPLLLQVLPSLSERRLIDGYGTDAVGDRLAMPVPGLIHKYRGRVLLALTGACAIHCRYCFRRHFPYGETRVDLQTNGPVMRYLADNTDVREVVLSGGDPLMAGDRKLAELIRGLNRVPHIRLLRIHSRVLSVLPERVNAGLLEAVSGFSGQVVFVTHINHPHEISPPNQAVFQKLSGSGYPLFNQSVLLKGVNDDSSTLADLSYRLFDSRIVPYYLHRLDKVQGAAHFDLPSADSEQIYRRLRESLPGYLVPLMVDEVAGQPCKRPVACEY
jgi:EF-P beta-lysylation protein EpmB